MKARTTNNLNLRRGPSSRNPAIRLLPPRTALAVQRKKGYWWKVEALGLTGWVYARSRVAEVKDTKQDAKKIPSKSGGHRLSKLTTIQQGESKLIRDLKRSQLTELQTALGILGYPVGEIDGLLAENSERLGRVRGGPRQATGRSRFHQRETGDTSATGSG